MAQRRNLVIHRPPGSMILPRRAEPSGNREATWIAGVDGCPGGWAVVLRRLEAPFEARFLLLASFAEVLHLAPSPSVIAVDIPIGLPERGALGGRPADRAARSVLGQRQSAVFAVPARAAVMCDDYGTACSIAHARSDPPRKVSKQTFNLFPKIREVDKLMSPELQDRVFEVHPEAAFWAMNGRNPLDMPKKVKSRPNPPGLELRKKLLRDAGLDPGFLDDQPPPRRLAGPDDLLDACANAWSAARIARGEAIVFPAEPGLDERGLRMEIRC